MHCHRSLRMTDEFGNELSDWKYLLGLRRETPPRYVPAPAEHVTGAKLIVVFDGDRLHISRAGSGTPVETIALPDGMRLCREVR